MTKVTLEIDCPEGIPEDAFRAACQEVINEMVYQLSRRQAVHYAAQQALQSDEGLKLWLKDNCITPPVVRAKSYQTKQIGPGMEIIFGDYGAVFSHDDPRRPVIMRGSKARRLHICKNHTELKRRMTERYMRRIKFTCFTVEDFWDYFDNHPRSADLCFDRYECEPPHETGAAWINGRLIYGLTEHQISYIKRLYRIIQKTEAIDKKRGARLIPPPLLRGATQTPPPPTHSRRPAGRIRLYSAVAI